MIPKYIVVGYEHSGINYSKCEWIICRTISEMKDEFKLMRSRFKVVRVYRCSLEEEHISKK